METKKKKKTHFTKFLICNEIGISIRVVAKFHFYYYANASELTLSWRRPLSYRNQSIDLRANQWTGFYIITASVMKELTFTAPEIRGNRS